MTKKTVGGRSVAAPGWSLEQAEQHLRSVDPVMARLIDSHGPCRLLERCADPFVQLITAIIRQLISRQAADAIEARVRTMAPRLEAEILAELDLQQLRSTGLSTRKADYIQQISRMQHCGELGLEALHDQPDAEISRQLTAIRGIGPWTAQMVLLFGYRRPDVLAPGDAALRRAVTRLYGEDVTLIDLQPRWSPYCSVASWYLWQSQH